MKLDKIELRGISDQDGFHTAKSIVAEFLDDNGYIHAVRVENICLDDISKTIPAMAEAAYDRPHNRAAYNSVR